MVSRLDTTWMVTLYTPCLTHHVDVNGRIDSTWCVTLCNPIIFFRPNLTRNNKHVGVWYQHYHLLSASKRLSIVLMARTCILNDLSESIWWTNSWYTYNPDNERLCKQSALTYCAPSPASLVCLHIVCMVSRQMSTTMCSIPVSLYCWLKLLFYGILSQLGRFQATQESECVTKLSFGRSQCETKQKWHHPLNT